jgi:excisionase family DNA binding protein
MSVTAVAPGDFSPLLVSRNAAAKLLGLCVRSVDWLISSHRLPSTKIGRRTMIPTRALREFAASGTAEDIRRKRKPK